MMELAFAITGIPNTFLSFKYLFLSIKKRNLYCELSLTKASANAIVVLFTPTIAILSCTVCSSSPVKYRNKTLIKIRKDTNEKKMKSDEKNKVIMTKM
jgi:hypothetical protein